MCDKEYDLFIHRKMLINHKHDTKKEQSLCQICPNSSVSCSGFQFICLQPSVAADNINKHQIRPTNSPFCLFPKYDAVCHFFFMPEDMTLQSQMSLPNIRNFWSITISFHVCDVVSPSYVEYFAEELGVVAIYFECHATGQRP